MRYFLAIDIGASSGRLILAHYGEANRLVLEEVHRFKNEIVVGDDGLSRWNVDLLVKEIVEGLKKVGKTGRIPERIGIDTFGVDYALLDENDKLYDGIVSYRDQRTEMAKKEFLTPETLFGLTGVYPHSFNTVYQLYDDQKRGRLERAKTLLMLPSYLAFVLTGKKTNELSIMSTTGLLDNETGELSLPILRNLEVDETIFAPLVEAGARIGDIKEELAKEIGFSSTVYAALEHDTAAAFYGAKRGKGELLLSSGTWSLMGTMRNEAEKGLDAFKADVTNELSYKGEIRFLKNITGMWMVNRLLLDLGEKDIIKAVEEAKASAYEGTFDANDKRLANPFSMKEAIESVLAEKHDLPKSNGDYFRAVFNALSDAYAVTMRQLEEMIGTKFSSIVVFGGGSKNEFLNYLTSIKTSLPVFKGPVEATAIGNILSISKGD